MANPIVHAAQRSPVHLGVSDEQLLRQACGNCRPDPVEDRFRSTAVDHAGEEGFPTRADLDRIGSGIERLRGSDDGRGDPDMLLSIVCGLYVMVRKSVGESIRAQADQALDVGAIESYLKGR